MPNRVLPADIVQEAIEADQLHEGPCGSLWAAQIGLRGIVTGWENRGPKWRGLATGGAKGQFLVGPRDAFRMCNSEAAVDAISHAQIEVQRADTAYVSTGHGWSPATEDLIRAIGRRQAYLVAATDNNRQGGIYADRIRAIAEDTSTSYVRSRPRAGDWNEDLKALIYRQDGNPLRAAE